MLAIPRTPFPGIAGSEVGANGVGGEVELGHV